MKCCRLLLAFVLVALVTACADVDSGDDESQFESVSMCSADGMEIDQEKDPTLPENVAASELGIARAAVACDLRTLENLAGAEFQYAPGAAGKPGAAEFWRSAEANGEPVLATLVELFAGPVVLDGETYVWPGTEEGGPRAAIGSDGTWQSYLPGEPSVLAAADDGRVIVLASDGTEQRELGAIAPDDATNGFAVSPDGRFAYFDRGGEPACEAKVVRLNLETGRERNIATGAQPALSPDGRRLAYLGCRRGSDFPDRLVVRQLKSGKEQRIDATGALLVLLPSWAPDSRHLSFEATVETAEEIRVVDVAADDPYGEALVVQLESTDNTFWAGYRGATGEFFALTAPGGEVGAGSPLPVIAIDARTGRTLNTLFALDAQCCVVKLAADRAGTSVLAAGTNAGLVVWRDGEAAPVPLAAGIRIAAWLPAVSDA